jgi:hypothetical protein
MSGYSVVMDAAGFMWVLDGNTDYYAGHYPGGLSSAVAIVHGLLCMHFCVLSADPVFVLAACTAANYFWNITTCVACPRNSSSSVLSYQRTQCLCDPGSTGPNGGPCTGLHVVVSGLALRFTVFASRSLPCWLLEGFARLCCLRPGSSWLLDTRSC